MGPAIEVPAASPVPWSPPRLWSPELPPRRPPLKVLGSNRTTPNSTQKALTYAKTHKSRYFHVSRIPNAEAVVSHTKSPPPSHSRSDSSTRSKHVSEPPDVAQKPPSLGERQLNIALSLTPPTKPDEVPSPTALPESPLDDFFMLKEGTNSSQAPDLTRTTYSHAGREQLNSRVTPSAAEIFTEVKTMEASEPSTSALSPPVYVDASDIEINSPDVEMGASLSNNASASRNGSSTDDRDEVDRTGSPDFQKSSPAQTVPPPYHLSYVQREMKVPVGKSRRRKLLKEGLRMLVRAEAYLRNGRRKSTYVKKHRESGIVGRQRSRKPSSDYENTFVVSVLKKEKAKHAYGRKGSKSKCNSLELWSLMEKKMSASSSASKQLLYSAMVGEFPGRIANVICSRHSFSYIVVTSPIYCEHRKSPITCFAFLQP